MKNTLILGIGCGAQNIINKIKKEITGENYLIIGANEMILKTSSVPTLLFPDRSDSDESLGCAGNVELGESLAKENCSLLNDKLSNIERVIIVACLGGGFGSGATPVVADYIKNLGIKTNIIVTAPFAFEGKRVSLSAGNCVEKLRDITDNVVVVSNDMILEKLDKKCRAQDGFAIVNNVVMLKIKEIIGK